MKKSNIGILSLSALLVFSALAPSVTAAQSNEQKSEERVKIQISAVENVVSKNELVERAKELFPGKFDFLSSSDFHMNSGHRYSDDDEDTVRYNLDFSKEISGKYLNGSFEFVGDDLQLNQFYYHPNNEADALFPAKVTKEEAQKKAEDFIDRIFLNGDEYKLSTQPHNYYFGNSQTLTEPIRYHFAFERYKNGVPISNKNIRVTVLGNGDITQFNGPYNQSQNSTYEDITKVIAKQDILDQIKNNFSVTLQYLVDFDYQTKETDVRLVYLPLPSVEGVHATTGHWQVPNSFVETLPEEQERKMLVDQQQSPKQSSMSFSEAKTFAENLLSVDGVEGLKLNINEISEDKNHFGQEVIRINFMYEMANSGHGTSMELDKSTGEILNYHDIKTQLLAQFGKEAEPTRELSYDEALMKAVEYAKEYAPSYLHYFAYPTVKTSTGREGYYFSFPRVENGILVTGQGLNINLSEKGSLLSFNVNYQEISIWPAIENVVPKEEIIKQYLNTIDLELRYTDSYWQKESNQYNLVYSLLYDKGHDLIDAITGEWANMYPSRNEAVEFVVTDHWAEEELNFMINAGIIKIKDNEAFNPNGVTTKGEALEVIMKSLTRFYDRQYPGQEQVSQSFENIQPDHDLYQVIERAVNLGILDKTKKEFAVAEPLSRQDLAVWYIRALGLEKAAKYKDIYKIDFADANLIKVENKGYVALTNALGILTTSDNKFRGEGKVTFAQLAVSNLRLAKLAYSDERYNRY